DGRVCGPDYGNALLCQAAVVIGLAAFVKDNWDSPAAARFSTIVMGSVVLFELCGPLLLKRCVVAGGEVKAMTLLRRDNAASGETSVVRITLRAMLRLLGIGARTDAAADGASEAGGSMSVKHIMRTNVQLIPASANLDELLHFIERSTQAHFPVVQEDGSLAGVIHFSDVRDVIYDPTLRDLVTAVDLADPNSAVVGIDMELTDLLDVFEKQNVAVLPVVEGGDGKRIVGLVEQRDVLRALHVTREPTE
ncbi:MAG: CBS domain-containing protein, partial [Planctomycetes bacterium]|nr:CBS domain-containing protein [Planctomycetota bacterium]